MIKKFFAVFMLSLFVLLTGCDKNENWDTSSGKPDTLNGSSIESQPVVPQKYKNPLTGLVVSGKDITKNRPVAIMINNIKIAQGVQTGLNKADIIYETEVEGGITRLMAVYQDISSVERIGTIRSARYPYVDLAMGHDAIYVHCGQDDAYCKPHLRDVDSISISQNNFGKRVSNGLASEHTLYTDGESLLSAAEKSKFKTTSNDINDWQSFANEQVPVVLSGGTCNIINIPFSASYKTGFVYDANSGMYTRQFNGTTLKDYYTGETTQVKNVFVLLTTIKNYPDGLHRQVLLSSGKGIYAVNGTYQTIKWSKGSATSSFVFTTGDGTPIEVNPGNSWVSIANMTTSSPIIQ